MYWLDLAVWIKRFDVSLLFANSIFLLCRPTWEWGFTSTSFHLHLKWAACRIFTQASILNRLQLHLTSPSFNFLHITWRKSGVCTLTLTFIFIYLINLLNFIVKIWFFYNNESLKYKLWVMTHIISGLVKSILLIAV